MVWAFTLVLALAACMLSVLGTNVPAFAGNNEGGEANSSGDTVLGSDVLSINVNTAISPIVYYAGKPWYVIAYDGTGNGVDSGSGGVTSNSGEDYDKCAMPGIITLFSKINLSGIIAYNYLNTHSCNYSGSKIEEHIKKIYGNDTNSNEEHIFTIAERKAIKQRILKGGSNVYNPDNLNNGYNPDWIMDSNSEGVGINVPAYLWPLSVKEAEDLPDTSIKYDGQTWWWLRTPGILNYQAAYVDGIRCEVNRTGDQVITEDGFYVRPAFYLDMESVIFTSKITGTDNEYKLTLKDTDMVAAVTLGAKAEKSGNTITVPYTISGSNAGNASQISILITDKPYNETGAKIIDHKALTLENGSTHLSGVGTYIISDEVKAKFTGDCHLYIMAENIYDIDDDSTEVDERKLTNYASIPCEIHVHKFDFSAGTDENDKNTVTAECKNDKCDIKDNKLTLTITKPELAIYGGTESPKASLSCSGETISGSGESTVRSEIKDIETFNNITGLSVSGEDITYVGINGTEYESSNTAPVNAGNYRASITINLPGTTAGSNSGNENESSSNNNKITAYIDYEIASNEITPVIELTPSSYVYDGNDKTPSVTVKYEGNTISDSEYTVSYSNNINAGTATVTISDKDGGNYKVNGSKTFIIEQADTTIPNNIKKEINAGYTIKVSTKLSNIKLPEGCSWEEGDQYVGGTAGQKIFMAKYTPEDSVNYKTVTGISVKVNVIKENHNKELNIRSEYTPPVTPSEPEPVESEFGTKTETLYDVDGSITNITTTKTEDGTVTVTKETTYPDGTVLDEYRKEYASGVIVSEEVKKTPDGTVTTHKYRKERNGAETETDIVEKKDVYRDFKEVIKDKNGKVKQTTTEKLGFDNKGTQTTEKTIEKANGYYYNCKTSAYKSGKVVIEEKTVTKNKTVKLIKETHKADGSVTKNSFVTTAKGKATIKNSVKNADKSETVKLYSVKADGTLKLESYVTSKTKIRVPEKVTFDGVTYEVNTIAKKAFAGDENLEKVTIGKNISIIGTGAFSGTANLKTVVIEGGNITKISPDAFKDIDPDASFIIKADKTAFKKLVKRIKKSGVSENANFVNK
jgi:hypothetical protein